MTRREFIAGSGESSARTALWKGRRAAWPRRPSQYLQQDLSLRRASNLARDCRTGR
jgi:hypothetical protein